MNKWKIVEYAFHFEDTCVFTVVRPSGLNGKKDKLDENEERSQTREELVCIK